MKVLSLFDGMSCGRLALERAGIEVSAYYRSEIDKYANIIAKKNYPDSIDLGDVNGVVQVPDLDLLVGGSPCQGFSFAGKQLNFEDSRSKLFFEFVRILKNCKPKYFLLENVKMKKKYQDVISSHLGVQPIEINSALVSAQNRKRLYWTNIPGVQQPEDRGVFLKDIVLSGAVPICGRVVGRARENGKRIDHRGSVAGKTTQEFEPRTDGRSGTLSTVQKDNLLLTDKAIDYMNREVKGGRTHWDFKHHSDVRDPKSAAVVANFFKGVPYNVLKDWNCIRKFDPVECERLQTVPDGYTEGVSNTQRYKMLGNGWTVDVIAHIFSGLRK